MWRTLLSLLLTMFAVYTFSCGTFRVEEEGGSIASLTVLDALPADRGTPTPLTHRMAQQMEEYFQGIRTSFDIPYTLQGTRFQKRVWEALCQIPYGQTRSYRDIAQAVGSPRAYRAVGMANHRNPVMLLVPCHRVIGADGSLGGYAGGVALKQFFLDLEQNTHAKHQGIRKL